MQSAVEGAETGINGMVTGKLKEVSDELNKIKDTVLVAIQDAVEKGKSSITETYGLHFDAIRQFANEAFGKIEEKLERDNVGHKEDDADSSDN